MKEMIGKRSWWSGNKRFKGIKHQSGSERTPSVVPLKEKAVGVEKM